MKKLIFGLMLVAVLSISVQAMTVTKPGLSDRWLTIEEAGANVMYASTLTPGSVGTSRNNVASGQAALANTFTVPEGETNLRLQKIACWGDGGDSGTTYKHHVRLLDLGAIPTTPYPTPSSYASGLVWNPEETWSDPVNLLNMNDRWEYQGFGGKQDVYFNFEDEVVTLQAGHTYAFEFILNGGPNYVPEDQDIGGGFYWERFNPAGYGAIYAAVNVDDARTLKSGYGRCNIMSVYLCPEPTTIALLCIGGLALLRKRS